MPIWLIVAIVVLLIGLVYSLFKKLVKVAIYLTSLIILLLVANKLLNLYFSFN